MTNEYPGPDGWQPLPQGGDYDSDATAFVQLPPDFQDAPLAAPGHGYVPPQITVSPATGAAATDPASTGVWVLPPELTGAGAVGSVDPAGSVGPVTPEVSWPAARQDPEPEPYPVAHQVAHPGVQPGVQPVAQGETGQWSIPLADGELPDESGEFTTSSMAGQWGDRTPPATLPGGAPAPWATESWAQPEPEPEPGLEPEPASPVVEAEMAEGEVAEVDVAEAAVEAEPEPVAPEPVAESVPEPMAEPVAEPVAEPGAEVASDIAPEQPAPDSTPDSTPDSAPDDADTPEATPSTAVPLHDDHPLISYVLRVNGTDRPVTDAWIGESLLYVLRERLGLAGAKDGCSQGECGACNVQVDGRLVASCLVPAATTAGSEVRTVEGLAEDGQASDVQRALTACGAVQCGFCVPGMAMTVHDLLEGNPNPTDLETRQALCGNLCRCSGYRGVLDAVRQVSAERKASQDMAADADADADAEPRIPHQGGPSSSEGIQNSQGIQGIQGVQGIQDIQDGGRE
ncbi:2Fe-2S iron-sulfur cluster-binding protein [Streptomyces sp. NPDC050085]|uniref:2Fe-2S iron-sulfur cluster-binding protein n=1 Tax=Streptomyces sp. NPDC050085 TaxID=3365600 RepID=UPI0037A2E471